LTKTGLKRPEEMPIKYGTSGWRANNADELTFANMSLVTCPFCNYLRENGGASGAGNRVDRADAVKYILKMARGC
jgi:hypothetical protein